MVAFLAIIATGLLGEFGNSYIELMFIISFPANICAFLVVHLAASEPPRPDGGDVMRMQPAFA